MFQFIRDRKDRSGRDNLDAHYLVFVHGSNAMGIARQRASDACRSARNLRHWNRVRRLVEQMVRRNQRAGVLAR